MEFPLEAPINELTITKPKSFDVFTTVILRLWPYGSWHHSVLWMDTDVLKEHAFSIFTAEACRLLPLLKSKFLACGKIYGGLVKGQFCSFSIQLHFPPEKNHWIAENVCSLSIPVPPVTINQHAPCNDQFLSIFVQVLPTGQAQVPILISSPWVSRTPSI